MRGAADTLRALHRAPELLVTVNVWDAASARVVAADPRCRAVATASWSIAAAHGVPDGEAIGLDAMLAAVARVAEAVDVPVSADLEHGFGDPVAAVRGAVAAGAAGCNLEDSTAGGSLLALGAAVGVVAAVVEAGEGIVLNARTDVHLVGGPADEALTRGRAFLEAGADCVFLPGLTDRDGIARAGDAFAGRLSLLAGPASPPLDDLAGLGVARVSFGPGTMGVALAALRDAAAELLALGDYPVGLAFRGA